MVTELLEMDYGLTRSPSQAGFFRRCWLMFNVRRYDSCDVGTLPNQTDANGNPQAAQTAGGNKKYNDNISWLPGQRLS